MICHRTRRWTCTAKTCCAWGGSGMTPWRRFVSSGGKVVLRSPRGQFLQHFLLPRKYFATPSSLGHNWKIVFGPFFLQRNGGRIIFWSPVENREGPMKSVFCVCVCVCVSVTDYLRNRSNDFPETWHEVGCKKRKFFLESCSFVRKKYIFGHFRQFLGLCGKSVTRIFLKSS